MERLLYLKSYPTKAAGLIVKFHRILHRAINQVKAMAYEARI